MQKEQNTKQITKFFNDYASISVNNPSTLSFKLWSLDVYKSEFFFELHAKKQ